jgi:uncharacterized membrane protein
MTTNLTFRWRYIILPIIILLLSVILAFVFYGQLPAEVTYRFKSDGSPEGSLLSRGMIILWMLVPQFLLALLATAVTWGTTKLGALTKQKETPIIKLESVLLLMGNMITLPQIILCFAMLDIFSYNAYQIHLMPVWVFAVIIMGLGAIILSTFFIRTIRQVWRDSL